MLVLLVPGASHLEVWKCCMTAAKNLVIIGAISSAVSLRTLAGNSSGHVALF